MMSEGFIDVQNDIQGQYWASSVDNARTADGIQLMFTKNGVGAVMQEIQVFDCSS